MGLSSWFIKVWRKIKDTYIEIRTVKKIYNMETGEEVTEKNNGCHIHGFLIAEPELRKIIDIGGKGSKGVVIPSSMLTRFSCEQFKVYMLEKFGSEPILVLTSPKQILEVGGRNAGK